MPKRLRDAVAKTGLNAYVYSNVDLRGEILPRVYLMILGFQGGGERRGCEIDRAVTRHPRTLLVDESCSHRLSGRRGACLSAPVLITLSPLYVRHFAYDDSVRMRDAHRCLACRRKATVQDR